MLTRKLGGSGGIAQVVGSVLLQWKMENGRWGKRGKVRCLFARNVFKKVGVLRREVCGSDPFFPL